MLQTLRFDDMIPTPFFDLTTHNKIDNTIQESQIYYATRWQTRELKELKVSGKKVWSQCCHTTVQKSQ